jgi:hypothetical protein
MGDLVAEYRRSGRQRAELLGSLRECYGEEVIRARHRADGRTTSWWSCRRT